MLKNSTNIPLSIGVWLATDTYDYNDDPNYISATSLLQPIKSIVVGRSIPKEEEIDIADLVPSKVGTAVHDQIELAWLNNYRPALKALGVPSNIINNILVNSIEPVEGFSHVYVEKRSHKKIGKWTIGGKFDFVMDGVLTDFKTTKTYSFISGSNEPQYAMQGSIYKWLNPDIITAPYMHIGYIFTDWIMVKSIQDKEYPPHNVIEKKIPIFEPAETENFIRGVLNKIDQYTGKPQSDMPDCTKEELWQNDSVWKY